MYLEALFKRYICVRNRHITLKKLGKRENLQRHKYKKLKDDKEIHNIYQEKVRDLKIK